MQQAGWHIVQTFKQRLEDSMLKSQRAVGFFFPSSGDLYATDSATSSDCFDAGSSCFNHADYLPSRFGVDGILDKRVRHLTSCDSDWREEVAVALRRDLGGSVAHALGELGVTLATESGRQGIARWPALVPCSNARVQAKRQSPGQNPIVRVHLAS